MLHPNVYGAYLNLLLAKTLSSMTFCVSADWLVFEVIFLSWPF